MTMTLTLTQAQAQVIFLKFWSTFALLLLYPDQVGNVLDVDEHFALFLVGVVLPWSGSSSW